MNLLNSRRLLSTVFLTALLSACGGSSSSTDGGLLDDPTGTDTGSDTSGTDTGSDTGPDTSGTDTGSDTGPDTSGTDTGSDTGSDTSGTDTGSDTGSDTSGTDTGSDTGSDTSGTETGSDTSGTDTGGETGGGDTGSDTGSGDGNSSTDDPDMLIPVVESGSDLESLLNDLHLHVGSALIDLNQRLSSGVELTEQQDICLGAYDPAFGEQLTAINCGNPLAITDTPLHIKEAAFYGTDNCHTSLSAGNSNDCQLQSASLTIKLEWVLPAGERRPVLNYPGALVNYAIGDTMLRIENDGDALVGLFNCSVDLVSGTTSSAENGGSCASILAAAVDRLDTQSKN